MVLLEARERLLRHGFALSEPVDPWGMPRPRLADEAYSLVEAINESTVTVARWHARHLLAHVAGDPNLHRWASHPYRTGEEVIAVIDKALVKLGVMPPRERYRDPRKPVHRGGWVCSMGPGRPIR